MHARCIAASVKQRRQHIRSPAPSPQARCQLPRLWHRLPRAAKRPPLDWPRCPLVQQWAGRNAVETTALARGARQAPPQYRCARARAAQPCSHAARRRPAASLRLRGGRWHGAAAGCDVDAQGWRRWRWRWREDRLSVRGLRPACCGLGARRACRGGRARGGRGGGERATEGSGRSVGRRVGIIRWRRTCGERHAPIGAQKSHARQHMRARASRRRGRIDEAR